MILKVTVPVCILFFASAMCFAQPNCNIYKWKGDSLCYKACLEVTNMEDVQGSAASQFNFTKAIMQCPTFEYAWYERSVPYLKRGDFITWKKQIDQVVKMNPKYLSERGWCRYKFLRDYEGAIHDIDQFKSLFSYDIGYSGDGDYHMNVLKALCYKGLGEKSKAIEIIERQFKVAGYSPRSYDYLHLGVLKLETHDLPGAVNAFKKELEINDHLADTYFYLSIAYKKLKNKANYESSIQKAKEYYLAGKKMNDPYTDPMDKVYLVDIENELTTKWE